MKIYRIRRDQVPPGYTDITKKQLAKSFARLGIRCFSVIEKKDQGTWVSLGYWAPGWAKQIGPGRLNALGRNLTPTEQEALSVAYALDGASRNYDWSFTAWELWCSIAKWDPAACEGDSRLGRTRWAGWEAP